MKNYSILISELAEEHLDEYYKWYESERMGLGREFLVEVQAKIESLMDGKIDYQPYKENIRKLSLHRFPYYVYYHRKESENQIVILAVLHSRRNPDSIKSILGK